MLKRNYRDVEWLCNYFSQINIGRFRIFLNKTLQVLKQNEILLVVIY